jgi:hypothetical protein
MLTLHVGQPLPGPHVFTITPARGPTTGAQDVVIQGSGFTPQTQITLDGLALVQPVFVSDGELHGQTPAHPAVGKVPLVASDALGQETTPAAYEYGTPPLVVAIEPREGPEAGGTPVTIFGYGLDSSTVVELGGAALVQPTTSDPRMMKGLTPPGSGTVDVVLLGPRGLVTDRLVAGFRYWPQIMVSDLKPGDGPVGRTVLLKGSGFTAEMKVRFAGTLASGLVVQNPTTAHVDVPAGSGTVDVTVSNPLSSVTLPRAFTYR